MSKFFKLSKGLFEFKEKTKGELELQILVVQWVLIIIMQHKTE